MSAQYLLLLWEEQREVRSPPSISLLPGKSYFTSTHARIVPIIPFITAAAKSTYKTGIKGCQHSGPCDGFDKIFKTQLRCVDHQACQGDQNYQTQYGNGNSHGEPKPWNHRFYFFFFIINYHLSCLIYSVCAYALASSCLPLSLINLIEKFRHL